MKRSIKGIRLYFKARKRLNEFKFGWLDTEDEVVKRIMKQDDITYHESAWGNGA